MNALKRLKTVPPFAFVLLLAAALPASAQSPQSPQSGGESYGYVRVLDGAATLVQASSRDGGDAEINQPVLAGDRLSLSSRTRMEVVLADHNLLRIDGGSEVLFDRLAASSDTSDRRTVLRLIEGNVQLVVDDDALGDDLPRIETGNATITIEYPGTFRITAERDGWTQVLARRGSARVESEGGSTRVRAGEELVVDEGDRDRPEADEAEGLDSLERWASRLDSDDDDDPRYIEDENLRYAARPLSRYGAWVTISGRPYWRPTGIGADWRPYWQGRWAYTPSGLTWVSSEPWGWVPYHYGSWDYVLGYGWVWSPGYTYAPAHVYWYWGSDYVGWCPTGYYTRYYGGLHASFRSGVYGWSHGGWGSYRNWNFVRPEHFGGRDQHRWAVPIDRYNQDGRESPGRGIITTDTRPLRPDLWRKPQEAVRTLEGWQAAGNGGRTAGGKGPRELPDVTNFIARKPQLSPTELKPLVANDGRNAIDGGWQKPTGAGNAGNAGSMGGTSVRKPRWTAPSEDGKPAREAQGSGWNDRRPREVEIPANGSPSWRKPAAEKPSGEPRTDTPSWRKPGREETTDAPSWRKPAERQVPPSTDTPSWRKPGREEATEAPSRRKPAERQAPPAADTPSWRKPSGERPPVVEDPAPGGDRGDRDGGSWRTRKPEGSGGSSAPTWSRPAPRGDSDAGSRGSRPTYERPAPAPERRVEPPAYRPSGGSGGSSSGGSQSKPAPSGEPQREAAPRKPSGGDRGNRGSGGSNGGNNGGDKGRARAPRPPADGDGDGDH